MDTESYSPSRRGFLRSSGLAALGLSTATGLTACAAAATEGAAAVFNPATGTWLADLAVAVGATQISNILHIGIDDAWHAWRPGIREAIRAHPQSYWWNSGWLHPAPPVVVFRTSKKYHGDPMHDHMVACVDYGESAVVFKAWAWQSLAMFVHDLTNGKSGETLVQARDLCVLTLIPSGVRPSYGRSPEGTVGWMTYESRNGIVEIAEIRRSGTSRIGVVTAHGMPDENGQPTTRSFQLPRRASA